MKQIEVVAAIIVKENTVFVAQRRDGEFRNLWEFPGGKIEKGENAVQALHREIQEELDITVTIESLFQEVHYAYPTFYLHLQCFLCTIGSEKITLKEHVSSRWLTRDQLDEVTWLPANKNIISSLKSYL